MAVVFRHQFQKFGLRSSHGNHPGFVSFSFWGTNNIGNAKDFCQILQALNCRTKNPEPADAGK